MPLESWNSGTYFVGCKARFKAPLPGNWFVETYQEAALTVMCIELGSSATIAAEWCYCKYTIYQLDELFGLPP